MLKVLIIDIIMIFTIVEPKIFIDPNSLKMGHLKIQKIKDLIHMAPSLHGTTQLTTVHMIETTIWDFEKVVKVIDVFKNLIRLICLICTRNPVFKNTFEYWN